MIYRNRPWLPDYTGIKPSFNDMGALRLSPNHKLNDSLVGWWLMNEGAGKVVHDLCNRHHGTLINNAAFTHSQYGSATTFPTDGGTDRVDLGAITAEDRLSGYATQQISMLVRGYKIPDASINNTFPRLFDKSSGGSAADGWCLSWLPSGDYWQFYLDGVAFNSSSVSSFASAGGLFDILIVADKTANTVTFYHDGKFLSSVSLVFTTFSSTTTDAAIGNWNHSTDRQWNGSINYVQIWDRALTPEEAVTVTAFPYGTLDNPRLLSYDARAFEVAGGAPPTVVPTSTIYGPLVGPMGGPI
jgi:hypothetical protein